MLYKFWRIFPGIFPEDFWFSHKNEEKKSAKKSGGSKIKIRKKSVLPETGPKLSLPHPHFFPQDGLYRNPKTGLGAEVPQEKLVSEAYRGNGGIA